MNDLEQIKQKIDIVSLISETVILKKTGANFKGLCPFHTEKTPSFVVSPERQIWHCFGSCQEGGDIFRFIMKMENIEFPEALKILAKRAGVKLTGSFQSSKTAEIKEKLYEINHLAGEYYHYLLTSHPLGKPALEYLKSRQITDSSVNLFNLGYAPNSWDSLTKFLKNKGYREEDFSLAGLASKSGIGNTFDRFRGRLMFTLKDHRGNVVGFAGRLLDPGAKEAKYVNTAETPVYIKGDLLYGLDVTKDEIKKEGFAVVVEGEIDAIQSYQAGVRNVVAIKGSALTEAQVSLLKRYTENVYLSLDADYAGDAAAHRGIETADRAGLNIKVVTFGNLNTKAKDPDELVRENPALWRQAVKTAVNFYDFIIDSALLKYDIADPVQGRKILEEVAKFIEPIENLVVKDHYLKKLAAKMDLPMDDLKSQLAKEFKKSGLDRLGSIAPEETKQPADLKSRPQLLEEYLISLLLQCPKPEDYLLLTQIRLKPGDFTSPPLSRLYHILTSLVDSPKAEVTLPKGHFEINAVAKLIPAELEDTFNRLYLAEIPVDPENPGEILEEIEKSVWEIKELSLRDKLRKISGEMQKTADTDSLEKDFAAASTALQELLTQKTLVRSGL